MWLTACSAQRPLLLRAMAADQRNCAIRRWLVPPQPQRTAAGRCRGSSPHIISQERGGWLNCPVICGGVIVNPGDIVIGNYDGVAVIPKARAEAVVSLAEERGQRYRGPNRIQTIPFRESHAEPIERIRALPDTEWR